jgi:hypothetical protein
MAVDFCFFFLALNKLYFCGLCNLPGSLTRLIDGRLPVSWPGQRGMYPHPNQIKSSNYQRSARATFKIGALQTISMYTF